LRGRAETEFGIAESTHGSSQGDINDVISGSSSIGISSKISSEDSKSALVVLNGWGNGCVQSEIFNKASIRGNRELIDSLESSEVNSLEISSWVVGWGQGGEVGLEDGVNRCEKEGRDDSGERGEGNESVEETILSGLASVPFILVRETNEKFIDEGISHAGFLSVSGDGSSGSPRSNDTVSSSSETSGWDFENEGNNVEPSDDIVGLVVGDASGEAGWSSTINWDEVDQIKNLSKVDGERFSALADEHTSSSGTPGNRNGVVILSSICSVVGLSLVSREIPRLLESGRAGRNIGDES